MPNTSLNPSSMFVLYHLPKMSRYRYYISKIYRYLVSIDIDLCYFVSCLAKISV